MNYFVCPSPYVIVAVAIPTQHNIEASQGPWIPLPVSFPLQPQHQVLPLQPIVLPVQSESHLHSIQPHLFSQQNQTTQPDSYMTQTLWDAHLDFLLNIPNEGTRDQYEKAFKKFFDQEFMHKGTTLWAFSQLNLEQLLDEMKMKIQRDKTSKKNTPIPASTLQIYCSALISFSSFLQRRTEVIKKIVPCKQASMKTFSYISKTTKSSILTEEQLESFFNTLRETSHQAFLFALLQYQGCRRISEVLNIKIQDIDDKEGNIYYYPLKSSKSKRVMVHYPKDVFVLIKDFLSFQKPSRDLSKARGDEYLFQDPFYPEIPLKRYNITNAYRSAWKKISKINQANTREEETKFWFPKSISHCLRSTPINVMIKKQIELWRINLVSGHSRLDSLNLYNTTGDEFNPSKTLNLLPWLKQPSLDSNRIDSTSWHSTFLHI